MPPRQPRHVIELDPMVTTPTRRGKADCAISWRRSTFPSPLRIGRVPSADSRAAAASVAGSPRHAGHAGAVPATRHRRRGAASGEPRRHLDQRPCRTPPIRCRLPASRPWPSTRLDRRTNGNLSLIDWTDSCVADRHHDVGRTTVLDRLASVMADSAAQRLALRGLRSWLIVARAGVRGRCRSCAGPRPTGMVADGAHLPVMAAAW